MNVSGKLESYKSDPFGFVDGLNLTFKGHNLNFFQKFKRLRKTAFCMAMIALAAWFVFGFDSTPVQFIMVGYNLPNLVSGQLTYEGWVQIYHEYYGKEMHYSAFVIYGLMYWALSRHFERNLGFTKSKNVAYAASLTLFSISLFEFYWMLSYSHFQNQPWVSALRFPQLRIILQNVAFFSVGVLAILYIWVDSFKMKGKEIVGRKYKFNWNVLSLILVGLAIASAVFWWSYPFHVERLTVTLENGKVWSNTNNFPQTLYTIDMNPDDNVNAGVWFFLENNLIHGVNTLVKVLWTLAMFYVFMLKPVGGDISEKEKLQASV